MSATDSIAYTIQHGGNVVIQRSYRVSAREMLDDRLRTLIREQLRMRIINDLAAASGLPFHRAITNIARWSETEGDPQPYTNLMLPREKRPVLLVTECYVKAVDFKITLVADEMKPE